MSKLIISFIAVVVATSHSSQARVFNFKSEKLSAYFAGGFGEASLLGANAFGDSSGASTEFSSSDVVPFTQMVELGFTAGFGEKLNMKVGLQMVQAKQVEVEGNNASGTKLLDVTSDVFVLNPNLVFEYVFSAGKSGRWLGYGGVGYSTMTVDNEYTMTALGQTTYSAVPATFTEKIDSDFLSYDLGVGYEVHFADTTTFFTQLGYRVMDGLELKYKGDGSNLAEGDFSHSANDRVKNNGGVDNRNVNMSGAYLNIGFRFYIDLGY